MKKIMGWLPGISLVLASVLFLAVVVKAWPGNPLAYQYGDRNGPVGSPFESTNSSSRYMLTEAIVENKRLTFDLDQARFSAPDLVFYDGKFFTIFTPGVSFVSIPFYLLGKQFGVPQLITYLSTSLFALLNTYLIYRLAQRLGASRWAAWVAGFIFLFGTNAVVYSQTLTQHHASVAVVLLGFLIVTGQRSWWKNILFGLLYGAGFLVDFPNLFLLLPLGFYVLAQHFSSSQEKNRVKVTFNFSILLAALSLIPMLMVFGWYNRELTGSPIKFGQFLGRTNYFDTEEKKAADLLATQNRDIYEPKLPFNTRVQLQGITIFGISNERSWLFYSPVVLLGIVGIVLAGRKEKTKSAALLTTSIIVTTLSLYTMFGDPWGGWSFGPRYLLPATALLCVFLGYALHVYRRNMLFIILFLSLSLYSVAVNTAGALTTAAIPPKQEAEHLIDPIPYTYRYNFDYLQKNKVSSGIYNFWLHEKLDAHLYHRLYAGAIYLTMLTVVLMVIVKKKDA